MITDAIEIYKELFNLVDTKRNGKLNRTEFDQFIGMIGADLSIQEIDKIMMGKEITFQRFVQTMESHVHTNESYENVLHVFHTLSGDEYPYGHMHKKKFKSILTECGAKRYSEDEANEIIASFPKEGDLICYKDFIDGLKESDPLIKL